MQQFNNMDPEDSSEGDADRQAVERMTRVCEAFRRDLQENRLARLEDFLDQIPQTLRAEALPRLLTIEDQHRIATDGKRLSNDEVLGRFPHSPDREVVEAWLGRRTTEVFDETKVDRPTHREEQSNGTPAKRYSGLDFPGHDFDLFEELGAGGQGQVYRVFDKRCSTLRAVKIFEAAKGRGRTYGSDLQNREAQHLARLRDRGAAVLTVHHAGQTAAGARYLVMDYCKQGSLDRLIDDRWDEDQRRPGLTWQECADLVAKLARTLQVVHAEGLYHFDIKPANILIGNDGAPLLADFAGSIDHIEFLGGGNIGWTWAYAAPEIRAVPEGAERKADGRTDLYSLGVVFYELLTGKLVTESPVRPQPPGQLRPEIPEDVDRLCLEMMEEDFEKRISSAKKVADRLERALQRDANPPMKRVKTAAIWGGWSGYLAAGWVLMALINPPKMTPEAVMKANGPRLTPHPLGTFDPPSIGYSESSMDAIVTLKDGLGIVEFSDVKTPATGDLYVRFNLCVPEPTPRDPLIFFMKQLRNGSEYQYSGVQFLFQTIRDPRTEFRGKDDSHFFMDTGDLGADVRVADFSYTPESGVKSHQLQKDGRYLDLSMFVAISTPLINRENRFLVELHVKDNFLRTVTINESRVIAVPDRVVELNRRMGLLVPPGTVLLSPPVLSTRRSHE